MIIGVGPVREPDGYGAGHYGARRGKRRHEGVDYAFYPGTKIRPVCPGQVTKLGWAYQDRPETVFNESTYRYVEVTDSIGNRHRYFYIEPLVEKGDWVTCGCFIGVVQDLGEMYPACTTAAGRTIRLMTNHVHYEVITPAGEKINPERLGEV